MENTDKQMEFQQWLKFYAKINWIVGNLLNHVDGDYNKLHGNMKRLIQDAWELSQKKAKEHADAYQLFQQLPIADEELRDQLEIVYHAALSVIMEC